MTVRERLRQKLAEVGLPTTHISGAKGYYRIMKHLDDTTVCWEACTTELITTHVVSYDTMTACVRRGFTVSRDEDGVLTYVAANPEKKS